MFVGSTFAYYDAFGLEGNSTHPFGPCSPGYDDQEPCLPCPPGYDGNPSWCNPDN
jgi:hypothetical protein